MNLEQRISLIKYELDHLHWCQSAENQLSQIFGLAVEDGIFLPCCNYEILIMVLNDLGIEDEARIDTIMTEYYQIVLDALDTEGVTTEQVKTFLLEIEEIAKEER